jgi:alpha-glucan,water dikinase
MVLKVKTLSEVQHMHYNNKMILLVDRIQGEEEIPSNVSAIVLLNPQESNDYPDVLAHVSVRARNLKVLLCVLYDA